MPVQSRGGRSPVIVCALFAGSCLAALGSGLVGCGAPSQAAPPPNKIAVALEAEDAARTDAELAHEAWTEAKHEIAAAKANSENSTAEVLGALHADLKPSLDLSGEVEDLAERLVELKAAAKQAADRVAAHTATVDARQAAVDALRGTLLKAIAVREQVVATRASPAPAAAVKAALVDEAAARKAHARADAELNVLKARQAALEQAQQSLEARVTVTQEVDTEVTQLQLKAEALLERLEADQAKAIDASQTRIREAQEAEMRESTEAGLADDALDKAVVAREAALSDE